MPTDAVTPTAPTTMPAQRATRDPRRCSAVDQLGGSVASDHDDPSRVATESVQRAPSHHRSLEASSGSGSQPVLNLAGFSVASATTMQQCGDDDGRTRDQRP
jgi:hypothetical protein